MDGSQDVCPFGTCLRQPYAPHEPSDQCARWKPLEPGCEAYDDYIDAPLLGEMPTHQTITDILRDGSVDS